MQQHRRLLRDFKALRTACFPPAEWAAHCERVHEFQNLLTNHCIAHQWRSIRRADGFAQIGDGSALHQSPTGAASAQQRERADLALSVPTTVIAS